MRVTKTFFKSVIVPVAFLMTALSGCGNVIGTNVVTAPPSSSYIRSAASTEDPDENGGFNSLNFKCQNNYSIRPQTMLHIDGTGSYEVCRSTQAGNTRDIAVHGRTANSKMICLYPAYETSPGNIITILSFTGRPVSQCYSATTDSQGIKSFYFSFAAPGALGAQTAFSAVYIVESHQKALMDSCILTNFSGDNCSSRFLNYSYGSF